jgi:hypothetical protein
VKNHDKAQNLKNQKNEKKDALDRLKEEQQEFRDRYHFFQNQQPASKLYNNDNYYERNPIERGYEPKQERYYAQEQGYEKNHRHPPNNYNGPPKDFGAQKDFERNISQAAQVNMNRYVGRPEPYRDEEYHPNQRDSSLKEFTREPVNNRVNRDLPPNVQNYSQRHDRRSDSDGKIK